MKKQYNLILLICLLASQVWAQKEQGRTTTTIIADILAQVPADNAKKLDKNNENIAALGQAGIVEMAAMLTAPGKGDNTKIQFAIGGFTFAATQAGKEAWRKIAAEAYGNALSKVNDDYNKQFLIYQLQSVGKDESVDILKSYLDNEKLSGPAARALARIGTTNAGKALSQGLMMAKGSTQISIIEALGEAKISGAEKEIEKTATSDDLHLRKVSLFALSEIAAPSSKNILESAAKKVAFIYDESDATAVYLKYLAHLVNNGTSSIAERAALEIIKSATKPEQSATRSSALKIYSDSKKAASVPLLVQAMKTNDSKYRASALKLAQHYIGTSGSAPWLSVLNSSKPEVQAEIISMLGRTESKDVLNTVFKMLGSKDSKIKMAAIEAAGKIGGESAVAKFIPILKSGNAMEVAAVKSSLLTIKGAGVVNQLATVLPQLPTTSQPSVIEIIASRQASDKLAVVSSLLSSKNSAVKSAAFSALKYLATSNDLPQMFNLLDNVTDKIEIEATQKAIVSGINGLGSKEKQSATLLNQMASVPANKQINYLAVLASVGDKASLKSAVNAYNQGDASSKIGAIEALSAWSDASAAPELLVIAKNTSNAEELSAAIQGYVAAIKKSKTTSANKVIMLRDVMPLAKNAAQKRAILAELSKNQTFNAMLFAGKYLDDNDTKQVAARAVMNIALANPEFYGSEVSGLLNKVTSVLEGKDSEYDIQAIKKHLAEMPKGEGFVSLFNGKNLSGWKGLVENPIKRSKMSADTLAAKQKIADQEATKSWVAKNGDLIFTGHGNNLCTVKQYGDFEMFVDWKIEKEGDAGIYLRGTPQVQIWDISRVSDGAQVGSGGLYNNQKNESKPSKIADNAIGEWNTFHITMIGDRVTVDLNGVNVVNSVTLENYWDKNLPIFAKEQIELQAHGTEVAYRDIYIREITRPEPYQLTADEQKDGYKILFDGTNMHEWVGNKTDYFIDNGELVIDPERGGKGNLFTKDEYSDFIYRFEFQLTPGANNGLGIRTPLSGDGAYEGTEIQILDNDADIYRNLKEYQYHGSAYGIIPAKRGFLKPVGEWNYEEVYLKGSKIKVTLNGTVILDGDLAEASKNGTLDQREHPGLTRTTGHIGYLGHGNPLRFKNIRILDLAKVKQEPTPAPTTKGKKGKKNKQK